MLVVNKYNAFHAVRWFKNGDHPNDQSEVLTTESGVTFLSEGKVIRRFNSPHVRGDQICQDCQNRVQEHGWVDAAESAVVCPGQWVLYRADMDDILVENVLNDNDFRDLFLEVVPVDIPYNPGDALDKLLSDGLTRRQW